MGPRFYEFLANFLLRMCRNDQNSTAGQIFNPKFLIPSWLFPIRIRNLVGLPPRFIRVLSEKWLL